MPTSNSSVLAKWLPIILAAGVAFGGVAMMWGSLQTTIDSHGVRLEKSEDRIDRQKIDSVKVITAIEGMTETLKGIQQDLKEYQKENNKEHRTLRKFIREAKQ